MHAFSILVEKLTRFCDRVAAFCIFCTMAVMVVNILLRALWGRPIMGTVDYVNVLATVSVALAVAYCALNNGQIAVEFFIDKFPVKAQAVIDIVSHLVALCFWGMVAWYMLGYAREILLTGLVSTTSQIPLYPVVYLVALGLFALCLVLVVKLMEVVRKVVA